MRGTSVVSVLLRFGKERKISQVFLLRFGKEWELKNIST
jgi:hypothetical protein